MCKIPDNNHFTLKLRKIDINLNTLIYQMKTNFIALTLAAGSLAADILHSTDALTFAEVSQSTLDILDIYDNSEATIVSPNDRMVPPGLG